MHVMLLTRVTGFVWKNFSLARKPKAIGHRASDVNKPINFQQHLNSFETVEVLSCVRAHRDAHHAKKAPINTFVGNSRSDSAWQPKAKHNPLHIYASVFTSGLQRAERLIEINTHMQII